MSRKSKGTCAEREVLHMFWKAGWACVRIAGSGSIKYPAPDILAGNNLRRIAMECKSTRQKAQYFTGKEIGELKRFSSIFGTECWVGVRFDRLSWYFFSLDDLRETETGFVISAEDAKLKGFLFEEMADGR